MLLISPLLSLKKAASIMTSTSLVASDGWKDSGPMLIHLCAPSIVNPRKRTNARKNRKMI